MRATKRDGMRGTQFATLAGGKPGATRQPNVEAKPLKTEQFLVLTG